MNPGNQNQHHQYGMQQMFDAGQGHFSSTGNAGQAGSHSPSQQMMNSMMVQMQMQQN